LKPGKWPFRFTGSDARSVVKPEWISPQIDRQCARKNAISRQQAGIGHDLVEVFRYRQRVPHGGALVAQARHQNGGGEKQDFRPRRRIVRRGDNLVEFEPRKTWSGASRAATTRSNSCC